MAERSCGGEISLHLQRRMKVMAANCVRRRPCNARPIGNHQAADPYDQPQADVDRRKPTLIGRSRTASLGKLGINEWSGGEGIRLERVDTAASWPRGLAWCNSKETVAATLPTQHPRAASPVMLPNFCVHLSHSAAPHRVHQRIHRNTYAVLLDLQSAVSCSAKSALDASINVRIVRRKCPRTMRCLPCTGVTL